MGHDLCDAIKASVTYKTEDSYRKTLPANWSEHVAKMVDWLPDLETLSDVDEQAKLAACVKAHTKAAVAALTSASDVIEKIAKAGDVHIVPAVYDMESGVVEVLE